MYTMYIKKIMDIIVYHAERTVNQTNRCFCTVKAMDRCLWVLVGTMDNKDQEIIAIGNKINHWCF